MLHFLRCLPRSFLAESVFLLTGVEPRPPIQDIHLPFNVTPNLEELTPSKLHDRIITSVQLTYKPLLFPELDSAVLRGVDGDGQTRCFSIPDADAL